MEEAWLHWLCPTSLCKYINKAKHLLLFISATLDKVHLPFQDKFILFTLLYTLGYKICIIKIKLAANRTVCMFKCCGVSKLYFCCTFTWLQFYTCKCMDLILTIKHFSLALDHNNERWGRNSEKKTSMLCKTQIMDMKRTCLTSSHLYCKHWPTRRLMHANTVRDQVNLQIAVQNTIHHKWQRWICIQNFRVSECVRSATGKCREFNPWWIWMQKISHIPWCLQVLIQ